MRDLVSGIERLDPFPDLVEALAAIKTNGFRLVVLSNGDSRPFAAAAARSRLGSSVRVIVCKTGGADAR